MSQRKKVAIIVPTYNVIAYIEECLQSIEKQTHKNYTVFLMDDGSTDGTKEYLSKWCSEHSKYKLYLLQHGGVSTARNKALDEITKDDSIDYVLFLDSDDMLTSNCLGDSVTACETSNCKVCSFAYIPLYKNTAIPKLSPNKLLLQNKEEIFSYYWNNTPKKFIKGSSSKTPVPKPN